MAQCAQSFLLYILGKESFTTFFLDGWLPLRRLLFLAFPVAEFWVRKGQQAEAACFLLPHLPLPRDGTPTG